MTNTWIFPAVSGVYTSPYWDSSNITGNSYFYNQISFAFYDDAACTILSVSQTGNLDVKGRSSSDAIFQPIEINADVTNPLTLSWIGVTNQLQVIVNPNLANTNYIKIFLDVG